MRITVSSRLVSPVCIRCLVGWVLLMMCVAGPNLVLADELEEPKNSGEFREPETTPEQQRTVTAAIYLLVALTMGAVTLLILLMLWGARVRREARKPLATTSPNDPLWYLKKPTKPTPGEPAPPNGVSEKTSDTNKPSDADSSD